MTSLHSLTVRNKTMIHIFPVLLFIFAFIGAWAFGETMGRLSVRIGQAVDELIRQRNERKNHDHRNN